MTDDKATTSSRAQVSQTVEEIYAVLANGKRMTVEEIANQVHIPEHVRDAQKYIQNLLARRREEFDMQYRGTRERALWFLAAGDAEQLGDTAVIDQDDMEEAIETPPDFEWSEPPGPDDNFTIAKERVNWNLVRKAPDLSVADLAHLSEVERVSFVRAMDRVAECVQKITHCVNIERALSLDSDDE